MLRLDRYGTPSAETDESASKNNNAEAASPTGPASPAANTTPNRRTVALSYREGVTNTAMDVMLATKNRPGCSSDLLR